MCVGETSKYVFTAKNHTTAKTKGLAFFKCAPTTLFPMYFGALSFQTKFLPEEPQAELEKASSAVAFTFSTKYIYIYTVILWMFQLHKYAQVCREYFI